MKDSRYYITLLFFLFARLSYGQETVLGYPLSFINPLDPFEQNQYEPFIRGESIKKKDEIRAWWVMVDRDNTRAYDQPDGVLTAKLKFGAPYFVVREKADWVELVDALVSQLQIKKVKSNIGWVRKKDLLLWNDGLRSPRNKVELKVILSNPPENMYYFPCDQKEGTSVYTAPKGSSIGAISELHGMYAVYKKEDDRYLIGNVQGLSFYDPTTLIGWVDKRNCLLWNTRVALEPNFTTEAYNERKNNKAFQVAGFEGMLLAEAYCQGRIGAEKAIWIGDPARIGQKVSFSDPKRLPGDFMRFPLLSISDEPQKSLLACYKSAVSEIETLKVECRDGISKEIQLEVTKPVYFCRRPLGAQYPTFSYVTCWSERELLSYNKILEHFVLYSTNASSDGKRDELVSLYCLLLDNYGGGEKDKACREYTTREIVEHILGVVGDGLDFKMSFLKDMPLKCLFDLRCTTDEDVEQQIIGFVNAKKKIERILRNYEKEEFVFKRDGEFYFWIKLSDLF
jgi:hypothetical protein